MWGDISLWLWFAFPWWLVMLNTYSCTYWLFACHLWENIYFGPLPKFCFPDGAGGKEPTCQCRRHERCRFDPWVRKILWRRAWQPTPVFLPGESHGQSNLVGHSPCGCKESDMTEQLSLSLSRRFKFFSHFVFLKTESLAFCYTKLFQVFWVIKPYHIWFKNGLSHSVGCLFILLIVSFDAQF